MLGAPWNGCGGIFKVIAEERGGVAGGGFNSVQVT